MLGSPASVATALEWLRVEENDYEVLLRGGPAAAHDELRRTLLAHCGRPLRMVTRSFSIDEITLLDDLRRATLMLMPSRAEAFGLAAVEAIAAGSPGSGGDSPGLHPDCASPLRARQPE